MALFAIVSQCSAYHYSIGAYEYRYIATLTTNEDLIVTISTRAVKTSLFATANEIY